MTAYESVLAAKEYFVVFSDPYDTLAPYGSANPIVFTVPIYPFKGFALDNGAGLFALPTVGN